jgi:CcmD family protein
MNFLYAAYAATWLIHIGYLGILVRRYKRLQKAIQDVDRK